MALLAFALAVLLPHPPPDTVSAAHGAYTYEARPVESAPTIDGHLGEASWRKAAPATGFRQLEPREGRAPSQRTMVRVLYGEDALYVGAMLRDDRPGQVRRRLARRDQLNQADWFAVSIDAYLDQQTARTFAVNAAGVQRDGIVRNGGTDPVDTAWDGVWRSAVRRTEQGWVAELRIPYDLLRFSDEEQQVWGIQFRRRIPRTGEVLEWPLVPRAEREASLVSEYGRLTGLSGLPSSRRFRVTPYTLGRVQTGEVRTRSPRRRGRSGADVGADFEVGLGGGATLDGTVNPDFGQVESDPAVLNLTAFETFFDEKRPFFVDETEIFDFTLGFRSELLYTRRIGADAPVIGALKLTGRSQNNLSYGAMAATTGDDFRPSRGYGAGHLQKRFGEVSTVGGMVTAYGGPPDGTDGDRRRSVAGGVNWDLRFAGNTGQVNGYVSGTHRQADENGPTTGFAMNAEVGRVRSDWNFNVGFRLRDDEYDPNDLGRLRENNFFRVSSFHTYQFNGGQPIGPFQSLSGAFNVDHSWSYVRRRSLGVFTFQDVNALTRGFRPISLRLEGDYLFGGVDQFETRGLQPRARPRRATARLSIGTDTRRSWQLTATLSGTARSDDGGAWTAGLDAEWNVGSRLKLSGGLSYRQELGVVEWAANETVVRRASGRWAIGPENTSPSALDDEGLTALERGADRLTAILSGVSPMQSVGGRPAYHVPVYGRRDTDRLDLTLRSNMAITKDLSFEFFGQLFGARGRYRDFRILSAPDDFDAFGDYPRRHDFARSSFIANAVLRWEFRPGSELFAVWSQDRRVNRDEPFFRDQRTASPYNRPTGQRVTDAFREAPRNTFILKLRYTIQ